MTTVSMELPEKIFAVMRYAPEEFSREMRLVAAATWYEQGKISQEVAAQIAGLDHTDFMLALSRMGKNSFHVDFVDLDKELSHEGFDEKNLRAGILEVQLPSRFSVEGIEAPTNECRCRAADFAAQLLRDFSLYPQRVSASVEEGIALVYKNYQCNKTLVVEIYNTLEVAALLNQDNVILDSWDIKDHHDKAIHDMVNGFRNA